MGSGVLLPADVKGVGPVRGRFCRIVKDRFARGERTLHDKRCGPSLRGLVPALVVPFRRCR
jgi:hypothetical protein